MSSKSAAVQRGSNVQNRAKLFGVKFLACLGDFRIIFIVLRFFYCRTIMISPHCLLELFAA